MRIKIIIALLITVSAAAQTKQKPPVPGTPRNFTIPEIRRFELPNGLKVRFVPYGEVPKATIRLVTQTGRVDESENEVWLTDLTTAMMKQGTTTRSAEQMAREAAMMGGALDVTPGMNQTTIGSDVFSESAVDAIALIADVARNPSFPEADLARNKTDLARRLSIERSQPLPLAAEKFSQVVFGKSPYGRAFPSEPALQGFTLAQVRGFHERNFGAARSFVYVVGRFDAAAVEDAIRKNLGDWKTGTAATKPEVAPVGARALHFIDRPGAVQSTLFIGLPVIDATHSDFLALSVMNALLGGSFNSRITSNIREQKGYTYSPASTITPRLGAAAWAEIADVTTAVTGASIKEILGEIERLRNEPPTGDELRGIQNFIAGTFVLRNSSRPGIAAQLAFLDLYGLSDEYLRNYVQNVYALAPADIQRLTRTYIDPAKLAIVVVGDRAQVAEQLKPYGNLTQ
ncbi:MAG TPA: pitrilysin family protein [Thermoanaerobaculia bacterium]|jgi:predicted Zn-dependent peptidase|nr:pitrilysin family protein [Thermoanaerobaculia bacterium]